MTDYLFPDDEDEEKPEAEPGALTEQEERDKRYADEAAQKLTRGGGLDEPMDRVHRTRILCSLAVLGVLLIGGGVAWAKVRAKEQSNERVVMQKPLKAMPVPDVFKKGQQAEPPKDDYDAIDPSDPAFTTPITTLPPAPMDDDLNCPAEYTPAECAKIEAARMKAEGDPDGRGPKYMGKSSPTYAANTGKALGHGDWEDEGSLAPLGYFGIQKHETSAVQAPAAYEVAPMGMPSQPGLQLPPNIKEALAKAAKGGEASDPDDVKEEFASRPGVLDSMDDERELAACELTAGTVIHVANLSAINTDVPAKSSVTAMVTQTVYCGSDNQHVAIPQGSTFTASANARVAYGDERIQLCMEQLRRPPSRDKPNGSVVTTKCWGAADITGMIGWDGEVDNHWDKLVAGVALSTLLSLGTTASAGNQEGFAPTIAQRAASNAGQQMNQAGQRIVQRDLARKPTITRKMLQSGTVVVTENKPLTPWKARLARRRNW